MTILAVLVGVLLIVGGLAYLLVGYRNDIRSEEHRWETVRADVQVSRHRDVGAVSVWEVGAATVGPRIESEPEEPDQDDTEPG